MHIVEVSKFTLSQTGMPHITILLLCKSAEIQVAAKIIVLPTASSKFCLSFHLALTQDLLYYILPEQF